MYVEDFGFDFDFYVVFDFDLVGQMVVFMSFVVRDVVGFGWQESFVVFVYVYFVDVVGVLVVVGGGDEDFVFSECVQQVVVGVGGDCCVGVVVDYDLYVVVGDELLMCYYEDGDKCQDYDGEYDYFEEDGVYSFGFGWGSVEKLSCSWWWFRVECC